MYTSTNGVASVFDILREEVPIRQLIETNGHRKTLCINHSEKTPSMHVYDDHVHCFGCGFHADVVDVWAAQRGIDRPIEAALDLAREFNIRLPEMNMEARKKAEERRGKEEGYLEAARRCHHALDKHPRVREWWEGRGFGSELREGFLLGSNKDGSRAVIPFWRRGRVVGLIHRKLQAEPKYLLPPAEEFPEGYKPLFIPTPMKGEIFLVEGYIDGLAVTACGRSAIAIGGTEISETQSAELRKVLPEDATIYILPDADESGAEAARKWGADFFPRARVCQPHYEGGKDIADAFTALGEEKTRHLLDRLAATSQDMIDIETEIAAEIEGGRRKQVAYAMENIVPLLARISDEAFRDTTADIVSEQLSGVKKSYLNKGIKAERERMLGQAIQAAMAEAEAEAVRKAEDHQQKIAECQGEIDTLFEPGVLGRLRDTAAAMHNVYGDREPLELALLVALGAQLDPLPNGRPLGASILLTAQAGRGKNHIVDAAVKPLPEEFYFAFEIASGQSLYYKADEDPEFLKHTFAYPNEIEGAEALWEFLRPMLSKGMAHKIVTAKDADGNMTTRQITVEGPVTIAIPTIRNKTDEQMQTRLLVAELPDYPGRVKEHSMAVSAQLLPDAATADYSREAFLWREGLRQLTNVRRVIFPLKHPDFALDDDQISHGARLWANLLSLMATAAWLEQKNRRILELAEGEVVVEATPDDYETAYLIFNAVCKRTVVNLSDTHRSILNGVYSLMENNPDRDGFRQREIAEASGVSLGAVSNHKTFLVMSAKLMKESDDGLALVEGADPSWWAVGDIMEGLPTPAKVRSWWQERDPDPPESPEHGEHVNKGGEQQQKADTYGDPRVHRPDEHEVNTDPPSGVGGEHDEHVHGLFTEEMNTHNGLDKPNGHGEGGSVQVFTPFTGVEGGEERSLITRVVNVRSDEPYDVYIGRAHPGLGLEQSDWHNPFKIGPVEEGKDGTREEVIEKFENYLTQDRPDLMARLPELRGKTLACWCKPDDCHGDVLAKLLRESVEGGVF